MGKRVNIIARSNGVGLDSDVMLLTTALEAAGHEVSFSHCRAKSRLAGWLGLGANKYDVNLFLERIFPAWLKSAKVNLLVPNQERFPERHLSRLKKIDLALCKSRHAQQIFEANECDTKFISFTSKDLNRETIAPDYEKFFHLAGKSTLKGTEVLLDLWRKHPEWPVLTLVQHQSNAPEADSVPANVVLRAEYLEQDELVSLINSHGVHLCPSRSEGWGHYIVEAMSCKAVVVTTDGPPMNELVTEERGCLVEFQREEQRHLGMNYFVDVDMLEGVIERLIALNVEEKKKMGEKARLWYEENHRRFNERIAAVFAEL